MYVGKKKTYADLRGDRKQYKTPDKQSLITFLACSSYKTVVYSMYYIHAVH